MLPCADPVLGDPATDTGVALTIVGLAQAFTDCKRRHADLSKWVKEQ